MPHVPQQNSNKMSLFEELIHETPKNQKSKLCQGYESGKKTPFEEVAFSSTINAKQGL